MIGYLVCHELRVLARNRAMQVLMAFLLIAIVAAALLSALRLNALAREKTAAAQADHEIWMTQGEQNPHNAAHFARYAFKPVPALAAFDPGGIDTAGLAIWMEGHYQDPAQFRRVEESSRTLRLTQLSPAWVLQTFGSLVIVIGLFAAIAGEREDGTLRQLLASGIGARSFALGKVAGTGAALVATILPATLVALAVVGATSDIGDRTDYGWRTAGLLISYGFYFTIVAAVTITVSALSNTRRSALATLMALWVMGVIIVPLFAADFGRRLHPDPDGRSVHASIVEASNAYFKDAPQRAEVLADTLRKHGVDKQEDLPFRYDGFELQHSEIIAQPAFARIYGAVEATHNGQETILDAIAFVLPTVNIARLSSGLAGTDRWHHSSFAGQAETHRRTTVKQLNDDLTYANLDREGSYEAGPELWAQIRDFDGRIPSFSALHDPYFQTFVVLLVQALLAIGLAGWALSTGMRRTVA